MKQFARKVLKVWKAIFRPIGVFNSYLLLTILYLLIVPIFSIKRVLDPLELRLRKDESYWKPRRQVDPTLERFHRPF